MFAGEITAEMVGQRLKVETDTGLEITATLKKLVAEVRDIDSYRTEEVFIHMWFKELKDAKGDLIRVDLKTDARVEAV